MNMFMVPDIMFEVSRICLHSYKMSRGQVQLDALVNEILHQACRCICSSCVRMIELYYTCTERGVRTIELMENLRPICDNISFLSLSLSHCSLSTHCVATYEQIG